MVQKSTVPSEHKIRPSELMVKPRENVFAAPVLETGVKNELTVRISFTARISTSIPHELGQMDALKQGSETWWS